MKNYNYIYHIIPIGEKGEKAYTAFIPKFPKVHAFGENVQELHEGVMAGIECAIDHLKKTKQPIPQEDKEPIFNGKILLRISPKLHEKLSYEALCNTTSLNKYIESKLR